MNTAAPLWYLYMLETAEGALYTGITTNVSRRLAQHEAGRGAKALRGRGPLVLRHHEPVGSPGSSVSLRGVNGPGSRPASQGWPALLIRNPVITRRCHAPCPERYPFDQFRP